ncbi:MAG: T9SS type A sorting domain-containing protein [Bacteroidales bacterium]|nr:T9SS type A sorting domain-containing protein [Bacteroidales bacterium]
MKQLKTTFLLIGIFVSLNSFCQNDTIIKEGYVTIAILKVDYNSYDFNGGSISYYSCLNCPVDSIPFTIDYYPPGDFGGVSFKLSSLQDTVFDATIIWMGTGQIYQPGNFSLQAPFTNTNSAINKPHDLRYINTDGSAVSDTNFINKADSAWNTIDSLEITKLFAQSGFKAAIYLYPPTVGMFNPYVAKWIIFLYHKDQPNAIDNSRKSTQFQLFPNPAKGEVSVNWDAAGSDKINYRIFDSYGKLVDKGEYFGKRHQFDLSFLSPGLYILNLNDNQKTASQKIIIK